jgi:hypothetical protein
MELADFSLMRRSGRLIAPPLDFSKAMGKKKMREAWENETQFSLALLSFVMVIAVAGLLFVDGNYAKVLRVLTAFFGYGAVLITAQRHAGINLPTIVPFALAGAVAGVISGVVRPDPNLLVVVYGTLGAAFLLGPVHWLGVKYWRALAPRPMES